MTLQELLAFLAALDIKMEAAQTLIGTGKDAEENKTFVADLNAICDEIEATNAEIEGKKAEELVMSRTAGFKKPLERKTVQTGSLTESDIKVGKDNIYDDPKLGFGSLGEIAMSAYRAAVGHSFDNRLAVLNSPGLMAAGLRQNNGPEGGFLVPPAFSSTIWAENQQDSLDLFGATANFNIGQAESISIPAIDETSRKNGSRWGGVFSRWAEEEATMTESDPTFREVTLRPKEIHVFTKVTDKLLRNSPIALDQFLSMAASDEITFRTSDAVINGDGIGKPKGILQSGALVVIAKESAQVADTVVLENVTKMYNTLPPKWLSGARWYIHRTVMPQLQKLTLGDQPIYLPAGTIAGVPFAMLMGLPVIFTEYNLVLGEEGDVLLTNLRAYTTAQRGGLRSDSSIHFNFDQNKTAFRWITEADGQTWMQNAVTDFQGTGTTSPYITLAERA